MNKRLIATICITTLCLVGRLSAFEVLVPNEYFYPETNEITRSIIVQNKEKEMKAFEITAKDRRYTEDGKEENEDVKDKFLIYPSQLILEPGEEEVVTVTWIGPKKLTAEEPYRIVVKEVRIAKEEETPDDGKGVKTSIRFLFAHMKSLYVTPKNAREKIVLDKIEKVTSGNEKLMRITLSNQGTAHKIFGEMKFKLTPTNPKLTFANGEKEMEFIPKELQKKQNYLVGTKRVYTIAWPENIKFMDLTGTVSVN